MFQTNIVEEITTNTLRSVTHFPKNRALYEIMWKKTAQSDRTHIFPCWITKATDIQSEYVILITFPRQQKLHERASMLHLYVHCMY
jgi:hypothetical protein